MCVSKTRTYTENRHSSPFDPLEAALAGGLYLDLSLYLSPWPSQSRKDNADEALNRESKNVSSCKCSYSEAFVHRRDRLKLYNATDTYKETWGQHWLEANSTRRQHHLKQCFWFKQSDKAGAVRWRI